MLYRILTEDLERDKIRQAAARHAFVAFTLIPSQGYWNGQPESSLTLEIDAPQSEEMAARVRELARDIKVFNRQDAVLVQEIPVSVSELI